MSSLNVWTRISWELGWCMYLSYAPSPLQIKLMLYALMTTSTFILFIVCLHPNREAQNYMELPGWGTSRTHTLRRLHQS
jgi:hypothetical protein